MPPPGFSIWAGITAIMESWIGWMAAGILLVNQLPLRLWGLLATLCLLASMGGCGRSPESLYRQADDAYRNKPIPEALKLVAQGMAEHTKPEDPWYWKFRMLEYDVLSEADRSPKGGSVCNEKRPAKLVGSEVDLECQMQLAYRGRDLATFERVAAAAGAAGFHDVAQTAYLGQAILRIESEGFETGEHLARKVLDYGRNHKNQRLLSVALTTLGYLRIRKYQDDEALPLLSEAFKLSGDDRRRRTTIHVNQGWTYYRLGDTDRAEDEFRQAQDDATYLQHTTRLRRTLWNIAQERSDTGRHADALQTMEQANRYLAADANPATRLPFIVDHARLAFRAGSLETAKSLLAEATRLADQSKDEPLVLDVLKAEMKLLDPREKAIDVFDRVAKKSKDPDLRLYCMRAAAEYWVAAGKRESAEPILRSAISFGEKERGQINKVENRIPFVNRLMPLYQDLVEVLISQGREREALVASDSSRALVFADRAGSAASLDLDALQRELSRTGAVAVSLWVARARSYAWVIDGKSIRRFELPGQEKLATLSQKYREFLEKSEKPVATDPDVLAMASAFKDVIPAICKARHVILVPDGALHSVALEALPHDGRFLIEHVPVAIAGSLWMLQAGRKNPPIAYNEAKILLVGSTDAIPNEFAKLRNAAAEMNSIRAAFPGGKIVEMTGSAANPEAMKQTQLGQFSLLHFATHASANALSPLDSAVILSAKDGNFRWSAREIMTSRLGAPLVTLSSCRAAGARSFSGEGLIGLTWAFLQAGARGVVAGLWEADDAVTSVLMKDFYERYTKGATPLEALTAAKRARVGQRPYYWAGFQYYIASLDDLTSRVPAGTQASR